MAASEPQEAPAGGASLCADPLPQPAERPRGAQKKPTDIDVAAGLCQAIFTPEFFEKNWEKIPLHWRAAEQGDFANLLPQGFTVDDVSDILRRAGSSVKLFRKGEPYEQEGLFEAYLDGASLIVNQADRYHPMLYGMCRALAARFFYHVFCVVYLTPPDSHAVRLHNDDQDVFLMQVWGTKHWIIKDAPQALPYTEEMLGKGDPVPEELVKDTIMSFDMKPGDVLYIPRGFLHEASTTKDPSLHITVTIPTSDYCWGVQLVKHLSQELQSANTPPPLRQLCAQPIAGARGGGPEQDAALDGTLKELFENWLKNLNVESVIEAFERRMHRTNEGQEKVHSQAMSLHLRPMVTEACRVRLHVGVTCHCPPGSDVAIFERGDQHMELPIAPSAAPLIGALSARPQPMTSLPCADAFERLCVLHVLCQLGVVQLFLVGPDEVTVS